MSGEWLLADSLDLREQGFLGEVSLRIFRVPYGVGLANPTRSTEALERFMGDEIEEHENGFFLFQWPESLMLFEAFEDC